MIVVYGIPNCDTVKKARAWLSEHSQTYTFHNFKNQGVPLEAMTRWIQAVGSEKLLNRKGTTWRAMNPDQQAAAVDTGGARSLMLVNPSIIKRPVVDWGNGITVGFEAQAWARRI